MTSWISVKKYLKENFHTEMVTDDVLKLTFEVGDLRTQLIFVTFAGDHDHPTWVDFHSPVGRLGEVDLTRLVVQTPEYVCGGVSTFGDMVTLRASIPLLNLDINELEDPLRILPLIADRFEAELTGEDKY